jgi:phosphatidylinositol alpha-mannosyltransferase
MVKRENPDCRLIAVGPGVRLRNKYEKSIKKNAIEDVLFTGYVSYNDLPRYYTSADIVCFPATGRESFGIVLLEAMAVGRPIVASDIDGYATVLTDGVEGIAVPPRDEEKLAESITRLIRDKQLQEQMGARGKPKAMQYDWSLLAKRVLDFYAATLDNIKRTGAAPEKETEPTRAISGKH